MNRIKEIIPTLTLIFFSGDTLTFGTSGNTNLQLVNQLIYVFLILILWIFYKNSNKIKIEPFAFATLIILLTVLFNFDFTLGYIVNVIVLLLGFIIVKKISLQQFVYHYNKTLFYLSATSLFFFLLFLVFPQFISYFPIRSNSAETEYINLYIYSHLIYVPRNTGIFREPGVYMIYLNLAVIFELFIKQTRKFNYLIVFTLALLTTLSAGGYVVFVLILFLYLLKDFSIKKFSFILFGFSIFILLVSSNPVLIQGVLNRFDTTSAEYSSSISRQASVWIPFNIFLDSPLWGIGFTQFAESYTSYSKDLYGYEMQSGGEATNTFFTALGINGLAFMAFLVYGLRRLTLKIDKQFFTSSGIFLVFLLMFSNEDLRLSPLFSTLLFYGFHKGI